MFMPLLRLQYKLQQYKMTPLFKDKVEREAQVLLDIALNTWTGLIFDIT